MSRPSGAIMMCPRTSWRSWPENPRPRPGARHDRLGPDRCRGEPPVAPRQRPPQDQKRRAAARAARRPRPPARSIDRRASARKRRGRGSVRQQEPAVDAQARPGARRCHNDCGSLRYFGRRICSPAGQESGGRQRQCRKGAGPRDGRAAAPKRGDRRPRRGGRTRRRNHSRPPSGECAPHPLNGV